MADRNNHEDSTNHNATDILYHCAQNLLSAVQLLNNDADRGNLASPRPTNRNLPLTSTVNSSAVVPVVSNVSNINSSVNVHPNPGSVQGEHRRLFGYRPPTPRRSTTSGNKKKRIVCGKNGQPIAINIKDTWTHSFVCLSNTSDDQTPSCKEKVELSMAGLGEKKIVFEKGGK